MKLDEIVAGFDAFEAAIEANQGELTPELAETLDALQLAEKDKVDRVVFYLKALQGEADALAKLGDEIHAKRQAKLAKKESLMRYVRWYMEQRGAEKLEGKMWRFQLCKSGKPPVEVLVPPEELPPQYQVFTVAANKEKLREILVTSKFGELAIRDDASMTIRSIARLGEPTQSLRIF